MFFAMILNSFILTGFLLLMIADLLWVKGSSATAAIRLAGYIAIGIACGLFSLAPNPSWPLPVPEELAETMSGWRPGTVFSLLLIIIAAISSCLLFWSVFLEIGIIRKKRGLKSSDIVVSGTYSLCRHPGFWWFAFLILSVGLLRGLSAYPIPIFLMIILDFLLILVQDRYTFPKVFHGYDDYKKSVPFLIPWKNPIRPR